MRNYLDADERVAYSRADAVGSLAAVAGYADDVDLDLADLSEGG